VSGRRAIGAEVEVDEVPSSTPLPLSVDDPPAGSGVDSDEGLGSRAFASNFARSVLSTPLPLSVDDSPAGSVSGSGDWRAFQSRSVTCGFVSPKGGNVSPKGGNVSPKGGPVSPKGGSVSPEGGTGSPGGLESEPPSEGFSGSGVAFLPKF